MESNICKNCRWWSPTLLVCFHDANEGIRVLDGNQKACEWINKAPISKELKEYYGYNEDNCV